MQVKGGETLAHFAQKLLAFARLVFLGTPFNDARTQDTLQDVFMHGMGDDEFTKHTAMQDCRNLHTLLILTQK